MRKIGIPEIEDIATGAALLGAGGGGDPYVGKLVAIGAVRDRSPVTLLDPEEVPDDALVVPIAMMGAPTVLAEKAIGGTEYQKLFEMVSKFFGQKIYAFMPIEAGGVNSMLPIAAAARLGMPMVDVDGMGRAFPELQMVTFTIGGMKATPMALVDEKGNSCVFETITNKWTEELARAVTMSCGASVSVSLYPMSGKQMKEFGVRGIVTRSQRLGQAIRTIKDCGDKTPEEHFLEMAEGFKLFKGKIEHVEYSKGGQEFCAGGQDKSLYVVRESAFNVVGEGRQRDAEKAERWERERRTYETRYNIGSQCFDCKYLGGGA